MGTRNLLSDAEAYALRHGLELCGRLGDGTQGKCVGGPWQGEPDTLGAQNSVLGEGLPDRRGTAYLRLQEHGITDLEGFHVPEMIRWDDEFLVIEMTIVTRPFVLDFAQAYLDFPPDFSPEVWEETHRR